MNQSGISRFAARISNGPPEDTPDVVVARMENVNAYWAERPDRYIQVRTVDDMKRAQRDGKLGVVHNFQSMTPLGSDPSQVKSNLKKYYDLGLRQMIFTYNIDTPYADGGVSNDDGTDQGVTELGEEVIKEMNRLGIVVDYIGNMVGRDKLCVGPDYVYNYADTLSPILKTPKNFAIEMGYATASHMGMPGEIWGVVRELQDRYGWSDDEIRGFLGNNLLRLYEANWK